MFKQPRSETDFASEIEAHLAIETDRLIEQGMSPADAQLAARKAFGNVTSRTEQFHESRPSAWLEAAWRNVRYAMRGLARRRAFAITAVLTLAFGIGVNSALFTLLYSLIVRPPPVGDPSQLVNVYRQVKDDGRGYGLVVKGRPSMISWPDYVRLREGTRGLEQLAVFRRQSFLLDAGGRAVTFGGELVSCNYFAAVRIPMARGRAFLPGECAVRGAGSVIVLSYGYWMREFGGDASIVGSSLTINRLPFTVVGVAAPGFSGLGFDPAQAWAPVTMFPTLQPGAAKDFDRDVSWLAAFGRLRPGATAGGVGVELTTLARAEDANWPGRVSTIAVTSGTAFADPDSRTSILAAVTGVSILGALILMMCCANVMNLLLARAAARRREIGIRLSLGASRARLVAQLMVESGLLAALGGALGLVLAWWLPPLIRMAAPDQELNLVLTPDAWVLAVTGAVALGAALLFGLVPALQSTNLQLTAAMRNDAGATTARGGAARWRSAAVGVQVAVSALLLVTAAMFLRATQRSFTVDPGFAIGGVTTLSLKLEEAGIDSTAGRVFIERMREQLATSPGVQSVALAQLMPMRGRGTTVVSTSGTAGDSKAEVPTLFNHVSSRYFEAMSIPIVRGRLFSDQEPLDPTPVIVSEAFARRAWPGVDAIGHAIIDDSRRLVVVGIARDLQSVSLGSQDGPYLYYPAHRNNEPGRMIVLRTDLPRAEVQALADRIAREVDPTVVIDTRTLEQDLQEEVAPVKLAGAVASGLGLVALLLAAVGVYGVVAFAVSQRSREIGIRMALGATRRSVQGMVFRQGARVVVIGLGIGILMAVGASQALRSMLFGLAALDPASFGGVAVLLSVVAAVAVAVPAARASRVDPVASLRED